MEQKKKKQTGTGGKAKTEDNGKENKSFDESRIKQQDWLVERFARAKSGLHKERFCFILGSGASVSSGIPSGITLEKKWLRYLLGIEDDRPNPENVPSAVYKKRRKEDTDALAEALKAEGKIEHDPKDLLKDGDNPDSEYYFDLYTLRFEGIKKDGHRYMEEVMEGCKPSLGYYPLAKILAETDNNMVITTNFDSLTEDALFYYTDKKPLVAGHEALAEYIDANIQRPVIAKVHRELFTDPMNSSDSTSELKEQWAKVLTDALKVYTPIVIGYGGGDRSLMEFLKSAELKNSIYWCVYGKDKPSDDILSFLMNKDGFMIKTGGFDSVMYDLGKALFPNEMHPEVVEELLKNMLVERLKSYNEGLNKLNSNDPAQKKIVDEIKANENEREKTGRLSAWDYYRKGNRAYDAHDFAEAVENYSKAIDKNQSIALFYHARGLAYYKRGKHDEAIADFNRAIELDPDNAAAYNNRGNVYNELGKNDEAIADYNRAIELKQDYAAAYNNRGYVYNELGKHDEAIADYNRAIELKPDLADAYNNRGFAYYKLGKHEEAIADYNRAIELQPDYAKAYRNRAEVYRVIGELDKAEADEARADEIDKKS